MNLQSNKVSAGILLYRWDFIFLEVFLVHPGGPFWMNKDKGVWSIPKGEVDDHTSLEDTAIREFIEETGFNVDFTNMIPLGSIIQKSGKCVHAWAVEDNVGIAPELMKCNTISIEYPPRSGTMITIPEVDRGEFFSLEVAKEKINPRQVPLIDALIQHFIS